MARPIIGIIGRKEKIVNKIDREANAVLYEYMPPLDLEDASYIGLITNSTYGFIDEHVLDMCDGIMMTGGVEIKDYHIKIIKYAIANKIPFLGICQGAQALALSTLTGEKLLKLDDNLRAIHGPEVNNFDDLKIIRHKVMLDEGSILYKIFGSIIEVNSNHYHAISKVDTPMKIVGHSEDGIIEAIEHFDNNVFAVGVQWHPEHQTTMQPLFKEFVNRATLRAKKR